MRGLKTALLVCFGGAAAALLGLAWDVSIHSTYPSLAQHETPLDPLSPAHDLIALGILVAPAPARGAISARVTARMGGFAPPPTLAPVRRSSCIAVGPPPLP